MQLARSTARAIFDSDPDLRGAENRRFVEYLAASEKLLLAQVS
jgi:hypothetical protein